MEEFGNTGISEGVMLSTSSREPAREGDPLDNDAGDADLVRWAARGDAGAFDRLFRRHYARVYHFALRLSGDRDGAEDLAQTAFVRAYRALPRIQDGQAFLKYLYRSVIHLVQDRARALRRRPRVLLGDLRQRGLEACVKSGCDPERAVVQATEHAALLRAIAELPLEYRSVVVLHHLQQMDLSRIAHILDVPEGTVKSRLARARQRLRAALKEWEEG